MGGKFSLKMRLWKEYWLARLDGDKLIYAAEWITKPTITACVLPGVDGDILLSHYHCLCWTVYMCTEYRSELAITIKFCLQYVLFQCSLSRIVIINTNMKTWNHENMNTWKFENLKIWKHENMKIEYQYFLFLTQRFMYYCIVPEYSAVMYCFNIHLFNQKSRLHASNCFSATVPLTLSSKHLLSFAKYCNYQYTGRTCGGRGVWPERPTVWTKLFEILVYSKMRFF